jgi:hypothetical protein
MGADKRSHEMVIRAGVVKDALGRFPAPDRIQGGVAVHLADHLAEVGVFTAKLWPVTQEDSGPAR